jgi:hypothetical protein
LLKLVLDPHTWRDARITSRFASTKSLWQQPITGTFGEETDMPDTDGVFPAGSGLIEAYIAPGRYAYQDFVNGKWLDSPGEWKDRLRDVAQITASHIIEKMMLDRFSE